MWTCDYLGTIDYKWVVLIATMSYSENSHDFFRSKKLWILHLYFSWILQYLCCSTTPCDIFFNFLEGLFISIIKYLVHSKYLNKSLVLSSPNNVSTTKKLTWFSLDIWIIFHFYFPNILQIFCNHLL